MTWNEKRAHDLALLAVKENMPYRIDEEIYKGNTAFVYNYYDEYLTFYATFLHRLAQDSPDGNNQI